MRAKTIKILKTDPLARTMYNAIMTGGDLIERCKSAIPKVDSKKMVNKLYVDVIRLHSDYRVIGKNFDDAYKAHEPMMGVGILPNSLAMALDEIHARDDLDKLSSHE